MTAGNSSPGDGPRSPASKVEGPLGEGGMPGQGQSASAGVIQYSKRTVTRTHLAQAGHNGGHTQRQAGTRPGADVCWTATSLREAHVCHICHVRLLRAGSVGADDDG